MRQNHHLRWPIYLAPEEPFFLAREYGHDALCRGGAQSGKNDERKTLVRGILGGGNDGTVRMSIYLFTHGKRTAAEGDGQLFVILLYQRVRSGRPIRSR